MKNYVELRISDMPEVLAAMRREIATLLRDEAESEADPRIARRLCALADTFEVGVRP
jgi:hypothetical protein